MFCLVIAEKKFDSILHILRKYQNEVSFFELRLDFWEDFSEEKLREILLLPKIRIICTYRAKEEGGVGEVSLNERLEILRKCREMGCYLVDVEWQTFLRVKEEFQAWPSFPERVLFSYHNFQRKPSTKSLRAMLRGARSIGAKIFKITTMVHNAEEALELLTLIPYGNRLNIEVIAFGMGVSGKWSRIASLFLGAPFTYVFPPEKAEVAPGQLDLYTAQRIFKVLG